MTLTAAQVRQACALLRWKTPKLHRSAKVSYEAARQARIDDGIAQVSSADVRAIRTALEKAGIRFETGPDGQPVAVLQTKTP